MNFKILKFFVLSLIIISVLLTTSFASNFNAVSSKAHNFVIKNQNEIIKEFSVLGIFDDEDFSTKFDNQFESKLPIEDEMLENLFFSIFNQELELKENYKNEDLFAYICKIFDIKKAENPYVNIKKYSDFGFISKDFRGYYESVLSNKTISDSFLNPQKQITFTSFFDIISIFREEIFALNGFTLLEGKIIENALINDVRTIKTSNNLNFKIKSKDNVLFLGKVLKLGTKCQFLLKDDLLYLVKGIETNNTTNIVVDGIYKAKLFYFDFKSGTIIFENLYRYENETFKLKSDNYEEFEVFGNFMTIENFNLCDRSVLNELHLGKDVIFITSNDNGTEKIVSIYIN